MSMFLAIFIFLFVGYSAAKHQFYSKDADKRPVCPCGSRNGDLNTRVVGGHDAGNGNFPYASCMLRGMQRMDQLNSSMPFCGATLISDSHVITAAHCLKYLSPEDVLVDISDYDLQSEVSHLRRAKSITRHPDYSPDKLYKDIALVEFERPVKWRKDVRAAVLPPSGLTLPPGTTVAVYGWGRMKYDGHHSDILQSAELPVVDSGQCQKSFWSTIQPDMLCAGGEEGHDACIGDSGSGLVVRLGNEYVLCGLVSFGRRCALKNIPGVYTRVSSYTDWIYQNTVSSSCRPCFYQGATPEDSSTVTLLSSSGNGTEHSTEVNAMTGRGYKTVIGKSGIESQRVATELGR